MYYGDADDDESKRFKFEQKGSNQLIVFGINPSTAQGITKLYPTDKAIKGSGILKPTDYTITKVRSFVERNGYDGFLMLNVCAQRDKSPDNLSEKNDEELHRQNIEKLVRYLSDRDRFSVLLAFGDDIDKRDYLLGNLKDIIRILNQHTPTYYHLGTLTEEHNPRHPSRLAKHTELILFQKGDGNGKWDFLFS